jgi:vitamin B12 transporter
MSTFVRRAVIFCASVSTLAWSAGSAHAETDIPTIVVSPYLVATPIARAGSTVSVIRRQQIENSSAGTVAQLLRTVPGVAVSERGGAGGQTFVSLRGAESQHTLVLIDGVRVNDPASARAQFDFATLTVTDIERIEILRGPQSALYGSEAMGGVINIIMRRPTGGLHGSVTAEGGSYGTRRVSGSVSGGDEFFKFLASGTYFATNGFSRVGDRDNGEPDAAEKYAGTLRASYTNDGKSLEIGLDGFHQASDIDRSPSYANPDLPEYDSNRDLLTGFGRLRFGSHNDQLANSITVFSARSTREFGEPIRATYYRGSSAGAEYQGNLKLGSMGSLLVGLRAEHESAYSKRVKDGEIADEIPPTYDSSRFLYAGYLLYQLPLDRLNLSFAIRHDGEEAGEGFTTGRVTGVYDIYETETRFRGSIGTGAKRPTGFQLSYNPSLDSESSFGADMGVEQTLFDGRLIVTTTGFYNRFSNMIDWDGDFFDGTYENIANAETAGVEVAVYSRFIPGVLTGSAAYTYLYSRDLTTGLPLQRRAEHSGNLSLTYTGIDKLEATVSATFVGKRFNDDAATVVLDPYARIDVVANYRVNADLSLFGRIENLLNADYEEISGYNTLGLSVYAGLTWRH